ncbi:hypothetical protein [Paenibacillus sp. 1P07SE]|uniref:hypothetical protein n=1 Tax=Paenibacillus sp. 1P07SE TaxID=3132209 RepID=UPI0039A4B1F4
MKKRHDTGAFEKQLHAFRQTLKQQLAANNGVPLKVEGTYIDYDMIDQPHANFQFINLTEKRIIAFEFTFDCYDAYGQKVKGTFSGNHRINANVGHTDLSPGQGSTYTTDLMWYERTHTLRNILVNKVAYSDGTVWKRK